MSFNPADDDYVIKLFEKRVSKSKKTKSSEKDDTEEKNEIDVILDSEEGVQYGREDIFFSEFDDLEDEEEEGKKDKKKKDDDDDEDIEKKLAEKRKNFNLMKFCKLSNPGLKGLKFNRSAYQEQFKTLFNNKFLSDVTVLARGFTDKKLKKIYSHKLILKTRSEYFRKMFETPLKESKKKEIEITNISYEILSSLIQYLYTGVLEISYQNSLLILAAANQLLLTDVKDIVSEYFEKTINSDIACMLYEESFFHNCPGLRKLCLSYIEENSNKVVFSDAFKQMTIDMIIEIIKSDYLSVDEYKLFTGLIEWAKAQISIIDKTEVSNDSIKKYLDKVIKYIRFPLMKPNDLRDKIEKVYPFLVPREYVMEAYRFHVVGGISSSRTRPRLCSVDFKWDTGKKSTYCTITQDGLFASTTYTGNLSISVCSDVEWEHGMYYWEITVESTGANNGVMIGVVDKSTCNVEGYMAYNSRGWGIYGDGQKCKNSQKQSYYGKKLVNGDVVGVLLNLNEKTLRFYINGKSPGIAYKDVTGPVCAAVSMYNAGDKLSLKCKCRPPFIPNE